VAAAVEPAPLMSNRRIPRAGGGAGGGVGGGAGAACGAYGAPAARRFPADPAREVLVPLNPERRPTCDRIKLPVAAVHRFERSVGFFVKGDGELGLLGGNEAGVDLGNGETVFWVPALYDPSWQPQQGGYVALLYDPTTSGKVNQRHVINNPQAVLMLLRKQINARRLAVLKARAPAIDRGGRGDDELAA
jgi:hypothetical protein